MPVLALLYAAAGVVACFFPGPVAGELAILPGAAIGIVGWMWLGMYAVVPLFVGALFVGVACDPGWASLSHSMALVASAVMALGAVLQAAVGATLVQRCVPQWRVLTRGIDGVRMFVCAVTLGTLPWALLRMVLRVALAGDAAVSPMAVLAAAWVAQMLGTVGVLPIAQALWLRRQALWRARLGTVALPTAVMLVVGLGLLQFAIYTEKGQRTQHFAEASEAIEHTAEHLLQSHLDAVLSTRRFLEANPWLDRARFGHFVRHLLEANPGLQALEWVPKVGHAERTRFEQRARDEGAGDFIISERGRDGALVSAASREAYYPVYFVEPYVGNQAAVGFDVASEAVRRAAVRHAERSGTPAVTAPVQLVQMTVAQSAVLVVAPVYRGDTRRGVGPAVSGLALGVVSVPRLIGALAPDVLARGMHLTLEDITDAAEPQRLYASAAAPAMAGYQNAFVFEFGQRRWRMVVAATAAFLDTPRFPALWVTMGGGVALLALLQGFLLMMTGQREEVAREVAAGTALLKAEVEERRRVEEVVRTSEARMRGVFDTVLDGIVIIDRAGIIDAFNPAAERIFGWRADEVIGRNVNILMPEPYHSAHDGYLAHFHNTGEKRVIGAGRTVEGKHRYGQVFPLDLAVSELVLDDRRMFVGVVRDVSDRVASAAQVEEINARLRQLVTTLERRDRALTALARINEQLMACNDREEAAEVVRSAMEKLFPGLGGMLAVTSEEKARGELRQLAIWGDVSGLAPQVREKECWAIRQGRPHEFRHHDVDLRCKHVGASVGACICVPLVVQGNAHGLISLNLPDVDDAAWIEQRRLLETLSESINLSLSNLALREMLRDQVIRDPLTRLYNRRYMEETLQREVRRAGRSQGSLGCAIVDLDYFKRINDQHGHDVGDVVLQSMAEALSGWFRTTDTVCRFGGEEFVVILPDPDPDATYTRFVSLQHLFAQRVFEAGEDSFSQCTFSVGIAVDAGGRLDAKQLLKCADEALYAAKAAGRNRVVLSSGDARPVGSLRDAP